MKIVFITAFYAISGWGGGAWLLWGDMHGCSRGACMVALGGHPCMVTPGGVHGCSGGGMCGCSRGHAWLLQGGMHGCSRGGMHGCSWGACVVAPRGVCMVALGGCAWDTTRYGDTINERAVRILLECILVLSCKRNHRRQTILQRSTLLFTITQYSCYRFCCNVTAFGLEQKAASCRFSILPQVL